MDVDDFDGVEVARVLLNRFIVIIGDSNQRCIYKDLVLLLQRDRYLTMSELKAKGEFSFLGDELIEGGCKDFLTNGTSYREVRQYRTDMHNVRFYFVTRCYSSYMEGILKELSDQNSPDILIMNSCLWDITRYGQNSFTDYKENLLKLFAGFFKSLAPDCLVIWNTTLPVSSTAKGGVLVPEIKWKTIYLKMDILDANYYAQMVASEHGYDVLDLHFYLRHRLHLLAQDGIHWNMKAYRTITNLIMSHVYEAWELPLPFRRAIYGTYGSAHARNGYYQQLAQDRQSVSGRQMNFKNPVTLLPTPKYFLQSTSQNFMFDHDQTALQNVNNLYTWQPYEQSSSNRRLLARSHKRYEPYLHRRR